jgi:hypothetical protein
MPGLERVALVSSGSTPLHTTVQNCGRERAHELSRLRHMWQGDLVERERQRESLRRFTDESRRSLGVSGHSTVSVPM